MDRHPEVGCDMVLMESVLDVCVVYVSGSQHGRICSGATHSGGAHAAVETLVRAAAVCVSASSS